MHRLRVVSIAVLGLLAAVVLSGCDLFGGGEDPETVISETFQNDETVSSGVLDISVDVSAEGEQGGSFSASLSGPFQGDPENPAALPQLDMTATATGEGAGQSIDFEGGLAVTEDNAFVEYGGETYEVGTETFSQFKTAFESQAAQAESETEGASATEAFQQQCEAQIEQAGGDPSACDIDVSSWFTNLDNEGTEDIEGTESDHISGDVDLPALLDDVAGLAAAVPSESLDGTTAPTEEELQIVEDAVTEASFDLYSGTDDRLLRGLDLNLAVDPSAAGSAAALVPIDSVDIGFEVRLGSVNEEQTIEAPTGARPLDELLGQFGLGGVPLGGLEGLDGAGGGGQFDFDGPGGVSPGGGAGSGAGGANQEYLDCIANAQTPEEINACVEQL